MKLYKYTSYEMGLKILTENKFRYTQPVCFNDPFELFPTLEGTFTDDQFNDILESVTQPESINYLFETTLKNEYDKLNPIIKSIFSNDFYSQKMRKMVEIIIQKKQLSIKELVKNKFKEKDFDFPFLLNNEYLKIINSVVGILCLSKDNENILMWSHYCDSHKGIVIKINSENSFFEYLDKVNYPEENIRPKLHISKSNYSQQESIEMYKKIFFNKSNDWSYEKEYRDYKALINGQNIGKKDEYGSPIILFEFPKEIIEGVIFGARVNENEIINFIKKTENTYGYISFEKAYLDEDKYKLNIYKISKTL